METTDRWVGIDALVAVIEHGSFSAAADALGIAKSTVSKRVARLEDRLGARLLTRTTRSVRPTDAGLAFYDRVAGLIEAADQAAAAVAELQVVPRGHLRVSAPMSFGHRFVVPAVTAFMARYPEVALTLDLSDRRVDLISEGFDMAIRVGELGDSSLIASRLCETRNRVVGARAYVARRGKPRTPRELREHDCLRYSYQASGTRWRFRDRGRAVTVAVSGPLECNSGDALLAAARAGLGLALLPDFLVDDAIDAGEVVTVLDRFLPPPAAVHILYPDRLHRPAAVRAFAEVLEDALSR